MIPDKFDSPGYDMVASFMLEKPISLLEGNILRLEGDIFDEIEAPTIKVSSVLFSSCIFCFSVVASPTYPLIQYFYLPVYGLLLFKTGGNRLSETFDWIEHNQGCLRCCP